MPTHDLRALAERRTRMKLANKALASGNKQLLADIGLLPSERNHVKTRGKFPLNLIRATSAKIKTMEKKNASQAD